MIHSARIWLPQTQTWLFNQVRFLPPTVRSHVVTDRVENMDQFGVPNLHCLPSAMKAPTVVKNLFFPESVRLDRIADGLRAEHIRFHVKRHGARIVHSHFGPTGWADLDAVRRSGARHIVTFYGYDVNGLPRVDPRWRDRYRSLFSAVDRVLCEGPHMGEELVNLGCPRDKLVIHHLGVAVDEIPFQPRRWISQEPLRVLIAGSFREKKGIPYALEALGRLQHTVPIEVTVIGNASAEPSSQREKRAILEAIERYQLQPVVKLRGYQPYSEVFREAYRHHVFLAPSVTAADGDTEGGAPLALIEMVATGMPVVSTFHCDIPNVVQHGVTGLLADERDVDGLVCHLRWLVDHLDEWRPMVEAARERVEREFNVATQGQRLAAIYEELACNGGEQRSLRLGDHPGLQ